MAPMAGRPAGSELLLCSEIRSLLPTTERPPFIAEALITPNPACLFQRGTEIPPYKQRDLLPVAEREGGPGWFRIRDPRVLGGGLEVPDARCVLAEDLRLDLWRQLWIAVAFDELVWDLELPEGVDLPLRIAPETGVGPHMT